MSPSPDGTHRKLRGTLGALILLASVALVVSVYLTSSYFQDLVRRKVIADLEQDSSQKQARREV